MVFPLLDKDAIAASLWDDGRNACHWSIRFKKALSGLGNECNGSILQVHLFGESARTKDRQFTMERR